MHPELLRALAQARHDDLCTERRPPRAKLRRNRSPRFPRSRRRVGSLLIWAGARVIGESRSALELAHE